MLRCAFGKDSMASAVGERVKSRIISKKRNADTGLATTWYFGFAPDICERGKPLHAEPHPRPPCNYADICCHSRVVLNENPVDQINLTKMHFALNLISRTCLLVKRSNDTFTVQALCGASREVLINQINEDESRHAE